jgi:hypothetical protein
VPALPQHHAYFTDLFVIGDGVTIEFIYTKLDGNRWAVRASIAHGATFAEFYIATDESPASLEELIATHRFAVSHIVQSWALAIAPKPKGQNND